MRRGPEDGNLIVARAAIRSLRAAVRRADRALAELERSTPVGAIVLTPGTLSEEDEASVLALVQTAVDEHPSCSVEVTVSVMAPPGA